MTDPQPQTPAAFSAEPPVDHASSVIPLRFTGAAGEYFRIWIVNAALSVLTLGIYSAWAKVRSKQYFYRHTHLADSSFEYLANPLAILKGRILFAVVLVAVSLAERYSIALYLVLVLLLVLATPWIIVQSLRFGARNTSYKNVRFSFSGTTGDSYAAYFLGLLVYMVSCGLGAPFMQWRISQFAVDGHAFGNQPFRFRTPVGDYFLAFLISIAISVPIILLLFALIGVVSFSASQMADGSPSDLGAASNTIMYGVFAIYSLFIIPAAYMKARIANLFWGGIDVGPHTMESTQTFKEVLVLQLTNIIGVVLSLGLLIPWAAVRSYRYRIEHLTLHTGGPLLVEARADAHKVGAFGDAATDLGDFELDLG